MFSVNDYVRVVFVVCCCCYEMLVYLVKLLGYVGSGIVFFFLSGYVLFFLKRLIIVWFCVIICLGNVCYCGILFLCWIEIVMVYDVCVGCVNF